jgi:hypothetical protein
LCSVKLSALGTETVAQLRFSPATLAGGYFFDYR